ncbi:MAG: hypothetical protein WBJ36_09805 [Tenuifilum sp.]|uniref:hypothetical protein n=1 Tax=Tenuifilum TaxID=2760873 RepID=UPI0016BC825A|nr:hypothetical protein [Bacteroidales bacterium]NLH46365.1 hypothetical protein [Acholeplasmataceae bacterium]HOK60825.1 hypothetical protein [Tenuifilum sp.]MBP9029003.1 hypothetical protein [Bacteroidales bacterium]HOK86261.1 hypothetical protein [Tenuifilum sp.]
MQDKNVFDPEKIALIDFKMIKGQVNTPENFDINKVVGYHLDNSLQLSFNLDDKLAKADFTVNVKTDSKGENESEATGNFHLIFIYRIENLEELTILKKNKRLNLNPGLANALSSVTYSTSRGILITRLQGTALQNFVLPIINPNKLLHNK